MVRALSLGLAAALEVSAHFPLLSRARRHRTEEPEEEEEMVETEEETWARSRALGPLASLPPRPGEGSGHNAPAAGAQARSTTTQGK